MGSADRDFGRTNDMRKILFRAKRINYEKFPKEEWWIEGNAFIHDDRQTVDIATGTEKFSINKRVVEKGGIE